MLSYSLLREEARMRVQTSAAVQRLQRLGATEEQVLRLRPMLRSELIALMDHKTELMCV